MSLFHLALFEVVALVGGRVHTLAPGAEPVELAVVIDGERVKALCKPAEIPDKARRIDVSGKHIVPAFVDALAYHDAEHDMLYTLAGIGTIVDHGNDLARILSAREPGTRSAAKGPEIFTAGALLDGKPPATSLAVVLEDAEAVRDAVEHLLELEIDFFATHANLTEAPWRELIAQGREHEKAVFGPRPAGLDLAATLDVRPSGIVALDQLLPPGRSWSDVTHEELQKIAALVAEAKVCVIPTLSAISKDVDALDPDSPDLKLLGPNYTSYWSFELEQRRAALDEPMRAMKESAVAKARSLLQALHAAGAKLAAGSGAPHPWLMPGEGLHRELAQWAGAGVPAADCLAACTRVAAQSFGIVGAGTIEVDQPANLVVLRADPTRDVAALREIDAVVRRGTVLDAGMLAEMRAQLVERIAEAKKQFDQPIEVAAPALPEGVVLMSGVSETTSAAGRIAAERWAVVREPDDTLTFCGQRRTPGGLAQAEVLVNVRQRVRKGKLASFEVRSQSGGRELIARGDKLSGKWQVERRLDGKFIDRRAAQEELAAVDCDSATTPMLLAHCVKPGPMAIVRFHEGLELEVVRWDLAVNEYGVHGFNTPTGVKLSVLDASGAEKLRIEQAGAAEIRTYLIDFDPRSGNAIPLPKETLEKLKAGAEAAAEQEKEEREKAERKKEGR